MNNEELNTALYKKMFAEQKAYKDWLLVQPAEELLRNAYEYVMREDILLSLENNDLSDRYATMLLKMDKPLAAVFNKMEHTESPHMEHVWECVQQCAYDAVEAEKVKDLPIYPHSAAYARDHGELAATLKRTVRPGAGMLVKGSRGMHMEIALELFLKDET